MSVRYQKLYFEKCPYIKKTREQTNRKGTKLIFLFEKCQIHTKTKSGTHYDRYQNIKYTNQIL